MALNIRSYLPADIDALIDLFRASIREVASQDYTSDQILAWAPDSMDRTEWLQKRASRSTWVAETDGHITGFTDMEDNGHIDMMYVHPSYQGQGIASALLETVETSAKKENLTHLHTEASITAKPFFERRGFLTIAPQTVHFNGQNFINYQMQKQLKQ